MNTMYVHYRREVWPVEVVRTTATRYFVRRVSDGMEMAFHSGSRAEVGHSYSSRFAPAATLSESEAERYPNRQYIA